MFCSTIIPTIGRTSLHKAVTSVLNQELLDDSFEIIVVNDSGKALPYAEWQDAEQVKIINTAGQRERSVARNTGAAIARGKFLHFLDDDDWLAPGAFQRFYKLAQNSSAAWLYGSSQLVDWNGQELIRLEHGLEGNCFIQVLAGEWIPLQASLIEAQAFFRVGGFNTFISGPEDIDLLRRICLVEDLVGFSEVAANIVRNDPATTTDYDHHPESSRWAREQILDAPGVFNRMRNGNSSAYWRGRIVRAYITSLVWNLLNRRFFSAISRAVYMMTGFVLSMHNLFSKEFWRAIVRPYASRTFAHGFEKAVLNN